MQEKTKEIAFSALLGTMMIVSGLWLKFPIPGTDVLFTSQVFFVLLCGLLFPPRLCLLSIGTYLFLGLIGLPVFSAVQGIGVLATPSFGYLLAFPFSAAVTSACQGRMKSFKGSRLVAACAGILVLYTIALLYISCLKGLYFAETVSFTVLLNAYCLSFLPMDILKGLLAALMANRLGKILMFQRMRF